MKKRGFSLAEGTLAPPNETVVLPGGATATVDYSFSANGSYYLMRVYVHGFSYKQKDLSNRLISTEWEVAGQKIPMMSNWGRISVTHFCKQK